MLTYSNDWPGISIAIKYVLSALIRPTFKWQVFIIIPKTSKQKRGIYLVEIIVYMVK